MRRALVTGSMFTVLVAASTAVAFVASAEESQHLHRHHERLVDMLGGRGAFLGVQLTEITPELRTHFGVPDDVGVMISRVVSESPAERAGLRVGDVIARVDGNGVDSAWALQRYVRGHDGGETIDLEVWRDGRMETISAGVETRERGAYPRALALSCEGEDCGQSLLHRFHHGLLGGGAAYFGCGDREDCDLNVRCEDGDCECTLNGEAADCHELRFQTAIELTEHGEE